MSDLTDIRHARYLEERARYERVMDLLVLDKPLNMDDRLWLSRVATAGIDETWGPHCTCGAPVEERYDECPDCYRDRKLDEAGDDEYDRRAEQHNTPKGA